MRFAGFFLQVRSVKRSTYVIRIFASKILGAIFQKAMICMNLLSECLDKKFESWRRMVQRRNVAIMSESIFINIEGSVLPRRVLAPTWSDVVQIRRKSRCVFWRIVATTTVEFQSDCFAKGVDYFFQGSGFRLYLRYAYVASLSVFPCLKTRIVSLGKPCTRSSVL